MTTVEFYEVRTPSSVAGGFQSANYYNDWCTRLGYSASWKFNELADDDAANIATEMSKKV